MFNKTMMALALGTVFMEAKRGGNKSSGGGTTATTADNGEPNMQLLGEIVKATQADSFVHVAEAHYRPLVQAGYVEINDTIKNDKGEVATRATQAGVEAFGAAQSAAGNTQAQTPASGPAVAASTFTLTADVPLPVSKRGGGRQGTKYPFDTMEVGQSFFVPNTADKPNMAKSFASTASSATARTAVQNGTKQVQDKDDEGNVKKDAQGNPIMVEVPNMVPQKRFEVRAVADGAPWGHAGVAGAGVWRTK